MTAARVPVLGITMGDPAGIGPEVIVKAFTKAEQRVKFKLNTAEDLAEAVTITTGADDFQFVVAELEAGSHGKGATMQRVHAVGVDEAGEIGRTTDAAYGDHVVIWDLKIDQRLLNGGQHPEVATSGTPVRVHLALEVGHRQTLGIC